MNRPIALVVGIVFVGLTIGIGHGIHNHGFNLWLIPIIAIVLGTFLRALKMLTKSSKSVADTESKRLAELESRMSDLQDIVILIDERLQRISSETTKPAKVSSQE
tara:strand:- start:733 stop:1047 length:315 start_codon:yes stop_codon:yes gene_type:complete